MPSKHIKLTFSGFILPFSIKYTFMSTDPYMIALNKNTFYLYDADN